MARVYLVPSDPRDVARDVVATLRDIVRFATDHNATRLPGIVARAAALGPVVESIVTVAAPCVACAERHADGCAMRNPPTTSRDAAIDAMIAHVNATLPDAYRAYAIDGETKRIDALYACACHADRAPRAPRATSTGNVVPLNADRVTVSVDNADHPTVFMVAYRDASHTFDLPADRNDHAAIVTVTADVAGWVGALPDITVGRVNAATKKLRSYGFYTTAAGYADWLAEQ